MERFFNKTVLRESGCLEWTAAKKEGGYGIFNCDGKHTMLAHRWAWIMKHGGTLKTSDVIMHKCDNPCCVNTDHLQLGTHLDNARDKYAKGRGNTGMRHYKAKLTNEQVCEIRASNMKQDDLAARYGVSQPTISEIRNRKVWNHT